MTAREAHPPPYAAVALDCDSTLSTIEGIEELTAGNAEVARLTEEAMAGRVPLEAVYGRRLELVRPTRADVDRVGRLYVERLAPGAAELVAALHALGKRVHVVSGGLLPPVRRLAAHLGVPETRVHAVDVRFDGDGSYAGFDEASPLARRGGKPDLLRALFPDGDVVLVGDGATDAEAAPACARFVAYAGVARRAAVLDAADRACESRDHAGLLPHLVSPEELERLTADPAHAPLVARAAALRTP